MLPHPFFGRQGDIFSADAVEDQRPVAFRFRANLKCRKIYRYQCGLFLKKSDGKVLDSMIILKSL